MKKLIIYHTLFSLTFLSYASAQVKQATSMYAMAASADNEFTWLNIERFDMKSCRKNASIFNKADQGYVWNDGYEKVDVGKQTNRYRCDFFADHFPTSNMVCAIAFSEKTNRVYFFPLGKDQLRWEDIGNSNDSLKIFGKIRSGNIHATGNNYSTEDGNITRAVIGYDGNGYALTNDCKHLYKFTDDAIPVITDLGPLEYDHDYKPLAAATENYGGDIVGLTDGNLLLITGTGRLFFIDVKTRLTTFLLRVRGLPKYVILSGAAVNDQNQLILSGSHGSDGYYIVKINHEAVAGRIKNSQMPASVSDLASPNFLTLPAKPGKTGQKVSIHPNPVQEGSFMVFMNAQERGNYTLKISDENGKAVSSMKINAIGGKTAFRQLLPKGLASGMYYFVLYNDNNEIVYHDKILVLH